MSSSSATGAFPTAAVPSDEAGGSAASPTPVALSGMGGGLEAGPSGAALSGATGAGAALSGATGGSAPGGSVAPSGMDPMDVESDEDEKAQRRREMIFPPKPVIDYPECGTAQQLPKPPAAHSGAGLR